MRTDGLNRKGDRVRREYGGQQHCRPFERPHGNPLLYKFSKLHKKNLVGVTVQWIREYHNYQEKPPAPGVAYILLSH